MENYNQDLPTFLWVLRDFALNIVNHQGEAISSKQYLEDSLQTQNDTLIEEND